MSEHEPRLAPTLHALKIWPEYFEAVLDGRKRFEIRRDDRGYKVGDVLNLREWDPAKERYTGRMLDASVTYLLQPDPGDRTGAPAVVMSIANVSEQA